MSISEPQAVPATEVVGTACGAPESSAATRTPVPAPTAVSVPTAVPAPTTVFVPTTPPVPARSAGARFLSRARAAARSVRWFVRELMGDSAYDKYVERHRLDHPDHEPMSSAQWWRAKADAEASAPQTRCC